MHSCINHRSRFKQRISIKIIALQSAQLDASYAFGAYSDQEEKYDIKIYKLTREYKEKLKNFSEEKKNIK